ncbi:MAG: DUF485 domain-containing protein [Exiguobacterium sp.]|uniref:DUF485 domain-containing protein n=1 Tax=Exiguobacterium alkaliphilum TaxID=1428684 RepID=A0ABT2KTJ5_9BACL|nr:MULTISPECIES: DUF485 domain-containing protein [Exiguobacterium]MDX5323864.1 DUF485 domain-containing protein [Exiguobacterium sp.]KDN59104.1 hypothetical protein DI14_05905 [Exiguobacterium sp. AB2]MCT4794292.1 DUF485 domain-containing protein [Exiguobacterium alkaliphilum]MDX5425684.1 DUF485 domain-containing protein [Exiguobacterium sp.]MDX6773084.1 DUF485 domain-containing protein [Exiguobacterium sp.]
MHDVTQATQTESSRSAEAIVESPTFIQLMREKNRFILPSIIFSLIFYFTLPVSTSYFTFLNNQVAGYITWAWVLAFAQFFMTWTFCVLYSRRARRFDELVEQIKQEETR